MQSRFYIGLALPNRLILIHDCSSVIPIWYRACMHGVFLTTEHVMCLMKRCFSADIMTISVVLSISLLPYLKHWGRDKMSTNVLTTISYAFSWMKICKFCLRFHRKFISRGLINNIPALVQIIAWRAPTRRQAITWGNDIWFIDAYMRHTSSMVNLWQTHQPLWDPSYLRKFLFNCHAHSFFIDHILIISASSLLLISKHINE